MKSQRLAQRLTLSILHSQENSVSKMRTHFDITTDFIFILFIYLCVSFFLFYPPPKAEGYRFVHVRTYFHPSVRPEP